MMCVHCGVNPRMNGVGSLCDRCWRTAPNYCNHRAHAIGCPCWISDARVSHDP